MFALTHGCRKVCYEKRETMQIDILVNCLYNDTALKFKSKTFSYKYLK